MLRLVLQVWCSVEKLLISAALPVTHDSNAVCLEIAGILALLVLYVQVLGSEREGYIKTHSTCIPYLVAVGRPRRFVSCPHPCDHCYRSVCPENIAIWRNALNFRRHLQVSSSHDWGRLA